MQLPIRRRHHSRFALMGMRGDRPGFRLALIGFACGVLALGARSTAHAEDAKPADKPIDAWAEIVPREAPQADEAADAAVPAPVDGAAAQADPDWTELGRTADKAADLPNKTLRAAAPRAKPSDTAAWSRDDNGNGTSSVAVKGQLSPFLDTRVGANMNLAKPAATTMADSLSDKMLSGETPKNSTGTAWATMTGPGIPHVWDKTAVDVSMDSGTDQGKLGTTLSRSVPIAGDAYSLILQNAYRLSQPAPTPLTSSPENRTLEIERSAKLSVNQTGTSLVAGQTLSSNDDKWLGKVGAEQKLLGDVTVTGSVNETLHGPVNKALTAGFKKSW
jgi:hypothetical protein